MVEAGVKGLIGLAETYYTSEDEDGSLDGMDVNRRREGDVDADTDTDTLQQGDQTTPDTANAPDTPDTPDTTAPGASPASSAASSGAAAAVPAAAILGPVEFPPGSQPPTPELGEDATPPPHTDDEDDDE